MRRTTLILPLAFLASTGCASSTNSPPPGGDSGSSPVIVLDSGKHDATSSSSSATSTASSTALSTADAGGSADTGTLVDGVADTAPADALTGDANTTDTGTTADAANPDAPGGGDAGGTVPTTCTEAHGSYGCCVTPTEVYYCGGDAGTTLKSESCTGGKVCVYDTSKRYYHCGAADAGVSTSHPATCGIASGDAGVGAETDSGSTDAGTTGDAAVPTTCAEANGLLGCCSGQTLYFCDGTGASATLVAQPCTKGSVCGWASEGFYDCGSVSGAAPGNNPPKACQ